MFDDEGGADDELSPAMLRASAAIAQYAVEQIVDLSPADAIDALELTRERLLHLVQERRPPT